MRSTASAIIAAVGDPRRAKPHHGSRQAPWRARSFLGSRFAARSSGSARIHRSSATGTGTRSQATRSSRRIKKAAEFWAGYLDKVRKAGSSIGAVIEVVAEGVPAGWGAPLYAKLDQDLASAMMSINAVKGVEIGGGNGGRGIDGRRKRRRNSHRHRRQGALSFKQRRRNPRRYFDGPADRLPLRREAYVVDPDAEANDRRARQGNRNQSRKAGTIPASASAPFPSAKR